MRSKNKIHSLTMLAIALQFCLGLASPANALESVPLTDVRKSNGAGNIDFLNDIGFLDTI